tara:strand:- start:477 stop:632 length:156 start_codon:yes stop_codon:yes gene_type:complete
MVDSTLPTTIYIMQYSSSGYDGGHEAVAIVTVEPTLRYIGAGMMNINNKNK